MKVKNKIKQILSIIVTAMMMMSLFTVSAFAKDNYTVTFQGEGAKTTQFSVYKVLNVASKDSTNISYSVNTTTGSNFSDFFKPEVDGGQGYTIDQIATNGAETAALALKNFINKENITPVATVDKVSETNPSQSITLGEGYYIVLQSVASGATTPWVQKDPILFSLPQIKNGSVSEDDLQIVDKFEEPQVSKNIININKGYSSATEVGNLVIGTDTSKANSVNKNDVIPYLVEADVPQYSDLYAPKSDIVYTFTDTFSSGLTYQSDLKVYGKKVTDGNWEEIRNTYYAVSGTLEVDFTGHYENISQYSKIRLTYTAKLNDSALVGGGANPNKVELSYSNNPNLLTDAKKKDDTVNTYTYGLKVVKKEAGSSTTLSGAKFVLVNAENKLINATTGEVSNDAYDATNFDKNSTTYVFTTDGDGVIRVTGLKEGTYKFIEIQAPNGYVTPEGDAAKTTVTITVTDKNYSAPTYENATEVTDGNNKLGSTDIFNSRGVNLPQTGGAGTWMFTIGGLVLMAGAVVVFMATRKKKAN